MTQEQNFTQPEPTLDVLRIELMITQSLKHNVKIFLMRFLILRIDQDVINEDHIKLVQLCHEYGVHQVHEMSRSIGQPKIHHQILIETVSSGENSHQNIFFTYLDLMVTRSKINL
jgi:hypothetical protein